MVTRNDGHLFKNMYYWLLDGYQELQLCSMNSIILVVVDQWLRSVTGSSETHRFFLLFSGDTVPQVPGQEMDGYSSHDN